MERESLLTVLMILFGGLVIQPFALIPPQTESKRGDWNMERRAWLRLWLPIMPALLVAAWLCGWALREPDPVDDPLGRWVLIGACLPFGVVAVRAVLRATATVYPSARNPNRKKKRKKATRSYTGNAIRDPAIAVLRWTVTWMRRPQLPGMKMACWN